MKQTLICGIDEVGRGCLAGPIVAVAALFHGNPDYSLPPPPMPGLKDSKAFNKEETRRRVHQDLLRCPHLIDFGIGCIWPSQIDKVGIDEANALAFYQALDELYREPDFLYVDGEHPVRHFQVSFQKVEPKADSKYWPVSAASILAKTIRDDLMVEYHQDFPQYGWDSNAGYGTNIHTAALRAYGPSPFHRKKFIKKIMEAR